MLIPGSHKANIVHPALLEQAQDRWVTGGSLDDTPGAISVFMDAGDAITIVDCCCHGSAKRTAEGERRFTFSGTVQVGTGLAGATRPRTNCCAA